MKKSICAIVGLTFVLGACEDAAGPEGDQLSRAEALQLAAQVMASSEGAATGSVTMSGSSSAPEGAGPPVNFTQTHESTHPCPAGGELTVQFVLSGTVDEDTNSLQADLDGSHVHSNCAFPQNGLTVSVDGAPAIEFSASIGAVEGVPSQPFTFTLDGALRWEASDGRSGVCPLELDAVTDFSEQRRTVQGSVCGHTVNDELTWS
ncbi:MAG TPA: hypothetical protein VHG09_04250 [Longimicrobiales bacterium]|nr:hypothetical protein [Longimicrobiales bacterium]